MVSSLSLLALVGAAAASPIMSVGEYARSLHARDVSVTQATLDNLEFYVQHAAAAYCTVDVPVNSTIVCGGECPDLTEDGVKVLGTFDGFWTGITSYVAIDHVRSEIVFSTRGSKNLPNWLANFDFIFVDSDLVDGGKAHQGFSNAWNEMSAGVLETIKAALASHPSYSVIVTGHSLGGAVATLGGAAIRAAGIPLDIYTYGSPRVGNDVLADFITAQAGGEYRVTRTNDPVPRLPPIFTGYRHTSPEYWLESYVEDGDDYPLVDVEVCEGNANVDCNAGQDGLDIDSHLYYFGPISTTSCDANSNSTAASSATVASTTSSSGKNTADQIKEYSAKDKQFVKST